MSSSEKRERIGWYFYDWANSAYPLVINTAIFPIYYSQVTTALGTDSISLFGIQFQNSQLYSYVLALSYVIVSIITPILSGIADFSGQKKFFLRLFSTLGSLACAGLFFFSSENLVFGLLMVMLASIGFSGSLVFYNAFLPEIAPTHEQDSVSARGFAMGYIGSSILLIASLACIMNPTTFGISPLVSAAQSFQLIAPYTFVAVALWWIGFSQITLFTVQEQSQKVEVSTSLITSGFREIQHVWHALKEQHNLRRFLLAFFLYSMGVQVVILMSTLFGEQELHLDSSQLITTVLIIQFIAVAGSYAFSTLSGRFGNVRALSFALLIWISVSIGSYFITTATQFTIVAAFVGLVLGGIQSLSRSTYSKLLPAGKDHASYFSFYDICEKIGIVIGMFSYGSIAGITGSTRASIVSIIVFFLAGFFVLQRVSLPKE